ncbi:group 1 truncated hemoglobin [Natronococcus pandeyae]|uniref:Group 1 truncated hemoglobin n=1 Tax=Natronococcus pandeyae TaxID=2055836 RepID=A0A8J8Q8J0_9EURY|nr:group 1 truncated hemoglobin [Natronococcus pandeyae]TYL39779.1 group 1 truncated hemoglobin [Natronococcus pandeyae]
MSDTLYDRLGGQDAIAAVVDRFYERMLEDDRVAHFFEDIDMQRQVAHQTQFLSAVTGGPVDYTGENMEAAHTHLDISRAEFAVVATHLEETLEEFEVDAHDREAVLSEVASYEDAIVTAAAD